MKDLIRPGLFLIARLSLLHSVSAWILSQGYFLQIVVNPGVKETAFVIERRGVFLGVGVVGKRPPKLIYFGYAFEHAFNEVFDPEFGRSIHIATPPEKTYKFGKIAGLFLLWFGPMSLLLLVIPHWLIVLCSTSFYGVLKLVYRNTVTNTEIA
ncbi:MAG: hypothetical protein WAO83_07545 [Fuerstiella sp.]|jgi:hypothetical protein